MLTDQVEAIQEVAARVLANWHAKQNAMIYGEVFTEKGVVFWTKQPVINWLGTHYSGTNDDWHVAYSHNLGANPWVGTKAEKICVSDRVYTHLKLVWS